MRSSIAAIAGVLAALVLSGMLGVASAEAPTTGAPVRSVSVGGVAKVPIAQNADAATATAAYRQGMAAAVTDGLSKAEVLAGKAGATLGAVQSITEGGGYISCTGEEENEYAQYRGEQPDFASPVTYGGPVRAVASPRAPAVGRPRAKHRRRKPPAAQKS